MVRSALVLLCAAIISSASEPAAADRNVRQALDDILAKSGISFGGEFKSQYFSSAIGGPGADSTRRLSESNEYTSVDFDIRARPNSSIAGRLVFRMHQNWQNFFSDISNPIFSRWVSIDADVKDMFRFNIGDFRTRWTPLTIYSPDIPVLYEPAVFARQRKLAMDEIFVGDNDRILQGVNFGFEAEIVPLFEELRFHALGVRLRNVQTDLKNGSKVTDAIEYARMAKYLIGANLDAMFLQGVTLGGSWMMIFDQKGSFSDDGSPAGADTMADTMAQRTIVVSLRPGVDVAGWMGLDKWKIGADMEFAVSRDDSVWFDERGRFNPLDSTYHGLFFDSVLTGTAMHVNGRISHQGDRGLSFGVTGTFMRNDHLFRNELAQSPSFLGHRIMNIDNDSLWVRRPGDTALVPNHYSTFDALYHSVFKFTPSRATNLWHKAPFMKNSYTRTIMTQAEMALHASRNLDPALQLVMPFGPATPNRQGITAQARAGIRDNRIELRGLASMLTEVEGVSGFVALDSVRDTAVVFPSSAYTQMGAGFSLELAALLPLRLPFVLSGSLVRSTMDNPGPDGYSGYDAAITSDFVNAGLAWNFWKRATLLGGLQMIATTFESAGVTRGLVQTHWTTGIEWKAGDAATVVGSVGQINVTPDSGSIGVGSATIGAVQREFSQWLVDLSLRVAF